MVDDVHVAYAVGLLVVNPGEDVGTKQDYEFDTYYSEDYCLNDEFKDRSNQMLDEFHSRLETVAPQRKARTVYFHNLSRFDGIILLRYYAIRGVKIRVLMRNNQLYQITVYRKKKIVYRLRDSLKLLPGSLQKLAKTLCPQLGPKGSIPHEELKVSDLSDKKKRKELLVYMKQDIRLLGGIMLKVQELAWDQYKLDIDNCVTLSGLALSIFRMNYFDPKTYYIHIPNRNEDTFIRRGYYGGHADVYIPRGEDLYYYDVNSLYPYIMKSFSMPLGKPKWDGNLTDKDLSNLFGFIEAFVDCPNTITRPFLPYRDPKKDTLLFPTGKFVGVYYSEELKYARNLGYKIIPLRGYLFEEMSSPFSSFVSSVFSKRQEAKKLGNEALVYV